MVRQKKRVTVFAGHKSQFIDGYLYVVGTSTKGQLLPDADMVWRYRDDFYFFEDAYLRVHALRSYSSAWCKGYACAELLLEGICNGRQ